ncbi:Helix-turn-helix domain containing protein [uncultured Caudovirales phage]|uniref:Helix-turn-helix domain containing protein n=1 Tax=uncultured Caudovirales phage TaxID=2100421 RepID=A0A6J5P2F6_9CAUD|nr:Helix-turn-helix domain containing protein [uncultured Caudovirales phage]
MKTQTSQNERILRHLRTAGSITWVEASDSYGVRSLTRRIRDLRDLGHQIIAETKAHKVTGQRYVRYHLVESPAQRAAA